MIFAVVPPLAVGASWHTWLYRALVLLVVSCPCALVISTPVSVVAALAGAVEPRIGPLAAAYVLITAVCGPVVARFAEPVAIRLFRLRRRSSERSAAAATPSAGEAGDR